MTKKPKPVRVGKITVTPITQRETKAEQKVKKTTAEATQEVPRNPREGRGLGEPPY